MRWNGRYDLSEMGASMGRLVYQLDSLSRAADNGRVKSRILYLRFALDASSFVRHRFHRGFCRQPLRISYRRLGNLFGSVGSFGAADGVSP